MKIFAVSILAFIVVFSVFAGDFQTVNEKSIKTFLQIYPQFVDLAEHYSRDQAAAGSLPAVMQYSQEAQNLLDQFGISIEDFSVLAQKISIGFAMVQMGESGSNPMLEALTEQMGSSLTSAELDVIQRYSGQIEEVLSR